ncbi:lipopolysaccharide assembly protein LapA domain-containing protein [Pseudomonas fluorescens]
MLENQQSVSLVFLGWAGPQLSIAVYIALAFLLGMAAGPVLVVVRRARRRPV